MSWNRRRGFSLVELLVAMTLGVVLIGGATTIMRGNLRSSELGQSVATMQAGARYALDAMSRDIRAAGYRGCTSGGGEGMGARAPLQNNTVDSPIDGTDAESTAVAGARVEVGGWNPSLPPEYVAPVGLAAPIPGTDALVVQYAIAPGEPLLADMEGRGSELLIAGNTAQLDPDALAILTDCTGADLFRIDTRAGAAGAVRLRPDRAVSRRYTPDPVFPLGSARVMPFVSAIYYIGDTQRPTRRGDPVRALYVQTFPYDVNNPPIELVEGVEQLQLSFGIRDAAGNLRYVPADDASYDPTRVTGVQVGLLITSLERLDEPGAARSFTLVGRDVVPAGSTGSAGAVTFANDGRLRMAFERTVAVRNRTLSEPPS